MVETEGVGSEAVKVILGKRRGGVLMFVFMFLTNQIYFMWQEIKLIISKSSVVPDGSW